MMPDNLSDSTQTTKTAPCQQTMTPEKPLTRQLREINSDIEYAEMHVRLDISALKSSLKKREELRKKREEIIRQIEEYKENRKNKKK